MLDQKPIHKQRLFFALMPDDNVRRKIANIITNIRFNNSNIKNVPHEKLHITLLFLGHVDINLIQKIVHKAKQIKFNKFQIKLNTLGYFSNSKAYWLGPEIATEELLSLEESIYSKLSVIPGLNLFANINHKNKYTPHVTLLKKVSDPRDILAPKTIPSIGWEVDRFYLLRSKTVDSELHYEEVAVFYGQ
jgi:2'-5' RNA ligase